jgi:hypothetical protein
MVKVVASNRESRLKYAPAVNRDLQEIDSNLSKVCE